MITTWLSLPIIAINWHLIANVIVNACHSTLQGRNPQSAFLHTPARRWRRLTCLVMDILEMWRRQNCNVSEILTLQLRAVFHPGPETDRSKIGQINNFRTLWGGCFQFKEGGNLRLPSPPVMDLLPQVVQDPTMAFVHLEWNLVKNMGAFETTKCSPPLVHVSRRPLVSCNWLGSPISLSSTETFTVS